MHPWPPNSLQTSLYSARSPLLNPTVTGGVIWGLKQSVHHELGLRAQQPNTVLLPLSTHVRPQRPERWWEHQLLWERISSLGSSCFPEDLGPPFESLPARRQAFWAHFPMNVPGLRVFLGNASSPFSVTATTSSANLTHWEFWDQCMSGRQDT